VIGFSIEQPSLYQGRPMNINDDQSIQFALKRQIFSIKTPAFHNIYNAIAAVCCGVINKIRYTNIKQALKDFTFSYSRFAIKTKRNLLVIDDTYNANPISFRSAIQTLNGLPVSGRKIAVCGEMRELGQKSRSLHQALGRHIAKTQIDCVLGVGDHMESMIQAIKNKPGRKTVHCRSLAGLHRHLGRYCQKGDAILVKGSRMMRMEKTVEYLEKLERKLQ
jgi:UDP-N-acetylmuramoyl-tripeptide--D-alanyl-D-alanine ligase